jgi:solute:Na+ symporter, SSS family
MTDAIASKGTTLDYIVIVVYFVLVVGFGLWFGRYTHSTKDFFFGGQRFAWWVIAFSAIATTVGSYSFIKYSEAGFSYGVSSSQTYLNDWFWVPILVLVWLPILYFGRIQSVPEYFERRFGTANRMASIAIILLYLVGYVGVNLYTTGMAMHVVLGWPIMQGAVLTALIVMCYMFAGGQTSVIMTDLAQGIILLVAGIGLFVAGVLYVGGWVDFWALLPKSHRYIFSEFNAPDKFSFIGIYAQDGLANTGAFMLMNQGMIMRFLSMKSVREARKMTVAWLLVLSPLACIAVSGGGWAARALVEQGQITTDANSAFVDAAYFLCAPGIFGFVLAALTAALMSTADTLVTAVSAIFVNDIYRPYVKRDRHDRHYLVVARITSTVTVIVGVLLVLVYMRERSVYQAHALFTAAVTPPIVMAILLGILWKRFTPAASFATMIGGGALVGLSFVPGWDARLVGPFSFGMGPDSYNYMRALYGLVVCGVVGVAVALVTKPRPLESIRGLVTGTQLDAMHAFKGGAINRRPGATVRLRLHVDSTVPEGFALVPASALTTMAAQSRDLLYISDPRWWFGGLRSIHATAGEPGAGDALRVNAAAAKNAHFGDGQEVVVEKLF